MSLLHLLGAIPYMLVLGVVKSFSPTTYGVTIHSLARDKNAVHTVHRIAWGVAAASTLLLLIFTPINPDELIENFKSGVSAVLLTRFVDLFAGVALVVLSAWLWQRRHKPKKEHHYELSGRAAFSFGFFNTLAGTSSIAFMYVTGRVLDSVSESLLIKVPLYAIFLVGLLGPYAFLIFAWDRLPRIADAISRFFDWVASYNSRPLIALAVLATGLVFFGLAVLR